MSTKRSSEADDRRVRAEQMKAERESAARAAERRTRLLVAVAVVAAIALVGVAVVGTQSGADADAPAPAGADAADGSVAVGSDEAPVVMDEWLDFSCAACGEFNEFFGSTISDQVDAGELRVRYHPAAFLGPGSELASNAFGCAANEAALQDDDTLAHDYLDGVFELGSDNYTEESLIGLGQSLGIDSPEFETCVNEGEFAGWVANVTDSMAEAGVSGTPTVFLNGDELAPPPSTTDEFLEAIEAAKAQ